MMMDKNIEKHCNENTLCNEINGMCRNETIYQRNKTCLNGPSGKARKYTEKDMSNNILVINTKSGMTQKELQ